MCCLFGYVGDNVDKHEWMRSRWMIKLAYLNIFILIITRQVALESILDSEDRISGQACLVVAVAVIVENYFERRLAEIS